MLVWPILSWNEFAIEAVGLMSPLQVEPIMEGATDEVKHSNSASGKFHLVCKYFIILSNSSPAYSKMAFQGVIADPKVFGTPFMAQPQTVRDQSILIRLLVCSIRTGT